MTRPVFLAALLPFVTVLDGDSFNAFPTITISPSAASSAYSQGSLTILPSRASLGNCQEQLGGESLEILPTTMACILVLYLFCASVQMGIAWQRLRMLWEGWSWWNSRSEPSKATARMISDPGELLPTRSGMSLSRPALSDEPSGISLIESLQSSASLGSLANSAFFSSDSVAMSFADGPVSIRSTDGREWRCSREQLGRGNFGTVLLGLGEEGQQVAIKRIPLTGNLADSYQEVLTLQSLDHRNIVSCYGSSVCGGSLFLILEKMSSSLACALLIYGRFTERQVKNYVSQVQRALQYLHERNIVHRDVKPANVLLGDDGRCKLSDLGLASVTLHEVVGTPLFMAPEVWQGLTSTKSDVWSLGMLAHNLFEGDYLFPGDMRHPASLCYQLKHFRASDWVPKHMPGKLQEFVSRCLCRDPQERPSMDELARHPFLTI
eukprot:NODE_634_length_2032_cov_12.181039_g585_i0.p1 GENE.NODE_634_length_2032_cov_12.181039_g585_i0~~NODE_634_length_2032_cov_12.181039_g585_i0.p1  ORF type:complete len:436 (+),score=43.00 NODE_634_length_2032_cov_12.181039_g585_i0:124-1431(+)